jgi:O-antigen/teichoic acid export membrane protein
MKSIEDILPKTEIDTEFKIPPRTSLFSGAMVRWFSMGVSIVLGLLVTPIIIRTLGDESYGLWGLAASFLGFYGLFDFGLSSAVSRFFGNAVGAKDLVQFNRVASTGRSLLAVASLSIIVFACLIIKPAQSILHIPQQHIEEFNLLVILSSVNVVISMMMSIYSGALLASEDYVFMTFVDTLTNITRSLAGVAVVLAGKGVVGFAVVNVVAGTLQQFVIFLRCRGRLPQMGTSFANFNFVVAKALIGFGIATYVMVIAEILRSRLDVMLVTRFSGLAQAGIYSVALTPFRFASSAILSVSGIAWYRLNLLHGKGDRNELRTFFLRASHITAACAVLIAGLFIGLAPLLFRFWIGKGYEQSAVVLQILLIGYLLDYATNPGVGSLFATAKHRYFAIQTTFEGIVSFTLAYILGAKYGMKGVAFGIVIPIMLVKLTIQPWYVTRNLGIKLSSYWFRIIGMTILATVVLTTILIPAEYCITRWGWWTFPLIIMAAVTIPGAILWRFLLDRDDRIRLMSNLKRMIGKVIPSKDSLKVSSTSEIID